MNPIFTSLLALFTVSTLTMSTPSGPTLNDLQTIICPSTKPFICLPYGACCSGSQFCHSGLCESCFPLGIEESALLEWCREKGQYDVTLMRHRGCRLACQDVFNTSQLALSGTSQLALNEFGSVSILGNTSSPAISNLHEVIEDNGTHIEKVIILFGSVCLVLSVSLNSYLVWRMWNSFKLKGTKAPVSSENSIESVNIDSKNNLGGNLDPKLDEEGKSLLHEDRDNQTNEELVIHAQNDDIDLANKRESKRDSTAAQFNLEGPQVRGAQSISPINETQLRTNNLMNRENSKMSLNDVIIHNEQDKSQDIANVHQTQRSPQSHKRQKPFLPKKTNSRSAHDKNELSIHSVSENDVRSLRGDESPEYSGREDTYL